MFARSDAVRSARRQYQLDFPVGAVLAQCGAKGRLIFDKCFVVESSHFETKGLATAAGTKFNCGKTHLLLSLLPLARPKGEW